MAQGLALGAGKPVLPLDSLSLVAEDARGQCGAAVDELWVVVDARMQEIYAGVYRWRGDGWQPERAPGLWPVAALADEWRQAPPRWVAGNALEVFGPDRLTCPGAQRVPQVRSRAGALARVAQQAWRAGGAVDAAQALPLYVRDRVALTTAERASAAAAR